jgi:hypothetical protein
MFRRDTYGEAVTGASPFVLRELLPRMGVEAFEAFGYCLDAPDPMPAGGMVRCLVGRVWDQQTALAWRC